MTSTQNLAAQSGTFDIADLGPVRRLGFGAMRLTGPGIWGEPADREVAKSVARRAVELGVDFIDTADSYGPNVSEEILAEALHPYPAGLRIATKAGLVRPGPGIWRPVGPPRVPAPAGRALPAQAADRASRPAPAAPPRPAGAAGRAVRRAGRAAGRGQGRRARPVQRHRGAHRGGRRHFTVATVQNRYNLTDGSSEDVLDHCTANGIGFIPWAPISAGELAAPGGPVAEAAERLGATPGRWRWRGCCAVHRRCCRSRAPVPSRTWRRTWPRPAIQLDDDTYAEITAAR